MSPCITVCVHVSNVSNDDLCPDFRRQILMNQEKQMAVLHENNSLLRRLVARNGAGRPEDDDDALDYLPVSTVEEFVSLNDKIKSEKPVRLQMVIETIIFMS